MVRGQLLFSCFLEVFCCSESKQFDESPRGEPEISAMINSALEELPMKQTLRTSSNKKSTCAYGSSELSYSLNRRSLWAFENVFM